MTLQQLDMIANILLQARGTDGSGAPCKPPRLMADTWIHLENYLLQQQDFCAAMCGVYSQNINHSPTWVNDLALASLCKATAQHAQLLR